MKFSHIIAVVSRLGMGYALWPVGQWKFSWNLGCYATGVGLNLCTKLTGVRTSQKSLLLIARVTQLIFGKLIESNFLYLSHGSDQFTSPPLYQVGVGDSTF